MKKRFLATLLLCLLTASLFAFPGTLINGTWNRKNEGTISLYKIVDGNLQELSTYKIGADGKFGFYLQPVKEGIYMIGTGVSAVMQDKYNFYFKGGEELNFNVNDSTYVLSGNNSAENIEMTKLHDMLFKLERKSLYFLKVRSNYKDFFPELELVSNRLKSYKIAKTTNTKFIRTFEVFRQLELYKVASTFLLTPRAIHPAISEYPTFYKQVNTAAFSETEGLLELPFSAQILQGLARVELLVKDVKSPSAEQCMELVSNDTLKGWLVLKRAAAFKSFADYESYNRKYGKYILTEDQKNAAKNILVKIAEEEVKPGKPGFDFSYLDVQGKNVSFSDFKGKVVLIDVWATWCGPCKEEIPHLKKLEEELKGKNVAIVSVSVDQARDKEKWVKMVQDEHLGGTQLFAAGWGQFAQVYKITGIPRFMVFDQEGKIVTVNAPRPSSPELKILLEKILNGKQL